MLKNMKIGKRLALAFLLMVLLMGAMIWESIDAMGGIQKSLDRIVKVNNVRLEMNNDMHDQVAEVSINLRNFLLDNNAEKRQEYIKRINERRETYNESFKKVEEELQHKEVERAESGGLGRNASGRAYGASR